MPTLFCQCTRPLVPHSHRTTHLPDNSQVRYPAAEPALPFGAKGEHFRAILGAHQSPLEALSLKRRVKGPGWLLLAKPVRREGSAMVGGVLRRVLEWG